MNRATFALLLLAAGCQKSLQMTPDQKAISDYVKANINAPATYEPIRWRYVRLWKQVHVDSIAAVPVGEKEQLARQGMEDAERKLKAMTVQGLSKRELAPYQRTYDERLKEVLLYSRIHDSLANSMNHTRLGVIFVHTYRAKNKQGKVVVDSARFLVTPAGNVSPF